MDLSCSMISCSRTNFWSDLGDASLKPVSNGSTGEESGRSGSSPGHHLFTLVNTELGPEGDRISSHSREPPDFGRHDCVTSSSMTFIAMIILENWTRRQAQLTLVSMSAVTKSGTTDIVTVSVGPEV